MGDETTAQDGSVSAPAAGRVKRWLASFAVACILSFCGFLFASCISSRGAGRRFVDALKEHHLEDARAMLSPDLQQIAVEPSAIPTADPDRAIALLWSAKEVRWRGVVQSGLTGKMTPFACFDALLDGGRPVFIVVQRSAGAWWVTDLRMTKPSACEGDHG